MSNDLPDDVQLARNTRLADAQFAGRLGGNQEFITSDDSSLLQRQPDAVSLAIPRCLFISPI
jgi:hypothetical protein